jgi:hypothetical protein
MSRFYILDDDNHPIESTDVASWVWKEANRERMRVGRTEVGLSEVSTVFLTMDHGWDGVREVFETMIFGGERDGECFRYSTWVDAKAGHDRIVTELKEWKQNEAS